MRADLMGICFLFDPVAKVADADTWVIVQNGIWRTTDAGANWTQVAPYGRRVSEHRGVRGTNDDDVVAKVIHDVSALKGAPGE
jgi:hypothetical protein